MATEKKDYFKDFSKEIKEKFDEFMLALAPRSEDVVCVQLLS